MALTVSKFMVTLVTVFIMGAVTTVTGGRPITGSLCQAANMAAMSTAGGLVCAESTLQTVPKKPPVLHRDLFISTINDLQRDFFLESALVVGDTMVLDANLRDAAPKSAFLTFASAKLLPPFTSSNAMDLVKHFGVAPTSEMASAIATAAYLCGYGALPGEQMSCAVTTDAMDSFVSTELGPKVKVLSTSNTPASAPAEEASVTIVDFIKGSVAEGKTIVVCHAVKFPSALYYCHRVTDTKVITASLKPAGAGDSEVIKGLGICHIDTSMWLSTHPAFNSLHIPRGDETCHWLIDSDLVFVPSLSKE